MAHSVSSSVQSHEVPKAAKFSIRKIRGGVAGDITWMFSIMGLTGDVLKQFELTKASGEALSQLSPGTIVTKIFGCGTKKSLTKHD